MQICDEAHRCAGRSTKRDAQPLSDGFLRASRRLFLTATPRLLGAKRDKEGELLATASMDDQALFGRVAYRLAYSDAVARRLVAPLKLVFLDLTKLAEEHVMCKQVGMIQCHADGFVRIDTLMFTRSHRHWKRHAPLLVWPRKRSNSYTQWALLSSALS